MPSPKHTVLIANAPTRIPLADGYERFFVKAGSRWPFSLRKRPNESARYLPFPFSLAYLAALLERDNVSVEVLDGVALNLTHDEFVRTCHDFAPTLIVMETTTPTIEHDLRLCEELKQRTGATIALAGAHVTVFAEEVLTQCAAVDWVFRGEYELNAQRAIAAWLVHDNMTDAVAGLPGVVCRAPDIVHGPDGEPIENLDALPFPARHLFPTRKAPNMWLYWDGFCQHRPAIQMHGSRGCPFRCSFCLWISVIYNKGPYRMFSASRIVDEMQEVIQRFGAKEIYFDDDIFTCREQHVLALCDEIRRRGIKTPWSVMGDAMVVTERAIDAMAGAGCIGMKFGIESTNKEILKLLRKPVRLDKVQQVVARCIRHGIKTHATVTFGLEGETRATMQQTLDFCCALPVDSIQFSATTPFPGTEHYNRAAAKGWIRHDASWIDYDGACSSVLQHPTLSADEIAAFVKKAPATWLLARVRDPAWVMRQGKLLAQLWRDQGIRGAFGRLRRAGQLLIGG